MEERIKAREKRLKSENSVIVLTDLKTNCIMYIYTTIHTGEFNC